MSAEVLKSIRRSSPRKELLSVEFMVNWNFVNVAKVRSPLAQSLKNVVPSLAGHAECAKYVDGSVG